MTLSGNWLIAASTTIAHHSGRKYSANSSGLLTVPVPDAYSQHTGQFLYWSCIDGSDRPTNTPGSTPWTAPVLDNTVGAMIYPIANSAPLKWVNASGVAV